MKLETQHLEQLSAAILDIFCLAFSGRDAREQSMRQKRGLAEIQNDRD